MFKKLMDNTKDRIARRREIMAIHKEMSDIRIQIKSAEEYILTLFLVDDVDTAIKYRVVLDYYEDRFGDLVRRLDRIKNPKE